MGGGGGECGSVTASGRLGGWEAGRGRGGEGDSEREGGRVGGGSGLRFRLALRNAA